MKEIRNLSKVEITKILNQYDEINEVLSSCSGLLDRAKKQQELASHQWNEDVKTNEILKNQSIFTRNFIKKLFKLYNILNDFSSGFNLDEIRNMQLSRVEPNTVFEFKLTDEDLYVKLPKFTKRMGIKHSPVFLENEFRIQFAEFMKQHVEHDFEKNRVMYIINVYPDSANPVLVPDNDNLDFKRTVDIISDFIGGGDGALTCSFFITAIQSNKVKEGGYVIVRSSNKLPLSQTDIVTVLHRNFHT